MFSDAAVEELRDLFRGGIDSLHRVWALRAKKKQGRMDMGEIHGDCCPNQTVSFFVLCCCFAQTSWYKWVVQGALLCLRRSISGTFPGIGEKGGKITQGRKHGHVKEAFWRIGEAENEEYSSRSCEPPQSLHT